MCKYVNNFLLSYTQRTYVHFFITVFSLLLSKSRDNARILNGYWVVYVATDNSIYRVDIGFKFPVFRCTYDSRGRNTETRIGARSGDEMCNLYMMFFVEPGTAGDFLVCSGEQVNDLFKFSVGIRRDINFSIRPDIRIFLCSLWGRALPATSSFVQTFR